jgi:hypothetical protein
MRSSKPLLLAAFVAGTCVATSTQAEGVAGALRLGTLGVGVDADFRLTEQLNLRVGYSAFNYSDNLESSDVRYDGDAKLRTATALLDWHPGGSGFRVSFGAVGSNTHVDVKANPTNGTFDFNGQTFTASEVGSVRGKVEPGNSFGPYVGIGWGNATGSQGRVSFLFDLGIIYMGSPDVNLTAACGPAAPTGSVGCVQLQNAGSQEERDLQDDADIYEWYPVASVGFAVKF